MSAIVAVWRGSDLFSGRLAKRLEAACAVVLVLGYAWLRAAAVWPSRSTAGNWYGDSVEYLRISRLPLGGSFFSEHKPWGYPFFLKLLETVQLLDALVLVQLALSVTAWATLAFVASAQLRSPWLRRLLCLVVLAFSASWPVAQWDTLPLSESLSLSLFALLLAGLIRYVQFGRPRAAVTAVIVGCAFAAVRDTHAPLVACLFIVVALATFRRGRRCSSFLVAAAVVLVLVTAATAGVRRWEILVADQIGKRAMLQPQMRAYFERAGMPARPDLSGVIFEDTRSFPRPATRFERDPRLAAIMPWFLRHGRATYDGYLLSHPDQSLIEPLRHLPTMIDTAGLLTYHDDDYRPALPPAASQIVYFRSGSTVTLWAGIALLLGLLSAAARALDRRALVPIALLASVLPLALIVWDGEPAEVPRHGLLVGVSARLGLILLLAIASDTLTRARSRRTAKPMKSEKTTSSCSGTTKTPVTGNASTS